MPILVENKYKDFIPAEIIFSERTPCLNPPPLSIVISYKENGRYYIDDVICSKRLRCPVSINDCPFKRVHAV